MVQGYSGRALVAPAQLADFLDLSYSPALLLDGRFDVTITDDPDFGMACEWGFDFYMEELQGGLLRCEEAMGLGGMLAGWLYRLMFVEIWMLALTLWWDLFPGKPGRCNSWLALCPGFASVPGGERRARIVDGFSGP